MTRRRRKTKPQIRDVKIPTTSAAAGLDPLTEEWWAFPVNLPSEPTVVREPTPERPEDQVRAAAAIGLLFALLFAPDRREHDFEWWVWCQVESCNYPMGSYSNVFWWSLRTIGDRACVGHAIDHLDSFHEYFTWKWNEYESGQIRRDGPKWF